MKFRSYSIIPKIRSKIMLLIVINFTQFMAKYVFRKCYCPCTASCHCRIYQMYQRYKIFLFIETSNSKSKLPGKRLQQVETRFKQMIWFAKYSWHDAMCLQTHFQNQHIDGWWRIYASVKLDQHLFRLWLVVCLAVSHYNNSGFKIFYTKKWILIRRLQTVSSMCWHNTRLNIIDVIMSTMASQITGVSVVC